MDYQKAIICVDDGDGGLIFNGNVYFIKREDSKYYLVGYYNKYKKYDEGRFYKHRFIKLTELLEE